ncbi:MAG: ShlB/FhaC/HecB family hemolysin secretion/activation protein [Burkholderiales bacterium]|nr:ShlB/FhaC/HecB family hemolysin secretion/activation protein [Burkholderiales bacterium]
MPPWFGRRAPRLAFGIAWLFAAALTQAQTAQPPAALDTPTFEIRRYVFEGASLIPREELERRTRPFTGRARTFADVQRALETVERAYGEAGYNAVQVVLPEQELERGEVRFEITEARIARVVVEGNTFFDEANIRASVPSLAPGTAPNIGKIARNLRVANENPSKQATVLLRSGEREGSVDAVVRVVDEDWQKWSITLDSTGTPETGRLRLGLGMQNSNFGYRDHVLSLQYVGAPYSNDTDSEGRSNKLSPTPSDRVLILGAGYHVPLYALGDSLDFIAGYSNVDSGTVQGLFNIASAGTIFAGRYTHNLDAVDSYNHRLVFAADYRAYDNSDVRVVGSRVRLVPDITVHPWSLGYAGQLRLADSDTLFSIGFAQNIPGGDDGTQDVFCATRSNGLGDCAPDRYSIWQAGFSHSHALPGDWQTRVAMSGQWTRDMLIPGEQFGLGGMDSVRGFFEREIANDKGYRGSGELYSPDLGTRIGAPDLRLRVLAFLDWGGLRRNDPAPGEPDAESISSTGLGVRLAYRRNLTFRTDWGYVLNAGGQQGKGDQMWHFRFSYVF